MERDHSKKNVASGNSEARPEMQTKFEGGTAIDEEDMDELSQKFQCMAFRTPKREKNVSRRQVQDMEEQPRAGWELDFLIEEQPGRFHDCSNWAMNPARLEEEEHNEIIVISGLRFFAGNVTSQEVIFQKR